MFAGTVSELLSGNLLLEGTSSALGGPTTMWFGFGALGSDNYANTFADGVHPAGPIFGNWVPEAAGTVPDVGATVLLLGSALGLLGIVFRRKTA